jgi:hypothetical protein
MIQRRTFVAGMAAVIAAPVPAAAQQSPKSPRIGVLRPGNPPPGDLGHRKAFEDGLRDLG